MKVFLVFSVCVFLASSAVNADPKSESDLRRALFANYDKLVRPVRSTTDTVPVRVSLNPIAIKGVDVDDREVKLHTWLFLRWQDSFLTWDPSEYGGMNDFTVPPTEVWIPDIGVYNGASDTVMFPTVRTNVVVYANGTVLWVPPFTTKAYCAPPTEEEAAAAAADTFRCRLEIGSWTYDITQLDLQEKTGDVLAEAREYGVFAHKKWDLESATAHTEQKRYSCCEELYPVVHYDMVFKKKPSTDD